MQDIFVAGTETSFIVLTLAFAEMMKNPHTMARAQSEVSQVFKGKKKYDEDLEKLTYLNLVVKETLRLHPPAPLLLPREYREQTDINGYTIPLKTSTNHWMGTHKSQEILKVGMILSFIPERFENSSIDFIGNHFEFVPFGAGRRMCPGILFGLANVTYPQAQLLFNFNWEIPNET
ncbi:hypothetical protein CQW23_28337 [Capsicum baccatum]|uniref:Uncharacterized protein n=1 Tax=Capsicum baccatum TaxID=33114 RepID=A0A2G2VG83_CAPBA|nr:hypothetical protein CQW23_28337 [Capsicum baccatum]